MPVCRNRSAACVSQQGARCHTCSTVCQQAQVRRVRCDVPSTAVPIVRGPLGEGVVDLLGATVFLDDRDDRGSEEYS